jgi:chemotaxis protein CheD
MGRSHTALEIFLQPGEYFVGDANYRIRTLLGSCVSITLWHAAKRVGAMSHFLLSSRSGRQIMELDGRFGEEAMWLLLRDMVRAEVAPPECEAKIFGGGDMFPNHSRMSAINVGQKNGETARRLLRGYGIPIVSESLFGVGHRQVIFDILTGTVWSRQVRPVDNSIVDTRKIA